MEQRILRLELLTMPIKQYAVDNPIRLVIRRWFDTHEYLVFTQFKLELEGIHSADAARQAVWRAAKVGVIRRIRTGVYIKGEM